MILQDSSHGVVGEEQGKHDLLHGCTLRSQCIIPGMYQRLPAYIRGNLADLFLLETLNAQRLEYSIVHP